MPIWRSPRASHWNAANQILVLADSEVSAIRGLDIKAGKVFTLVGHRGLFTFGDVDGDPESGAAATCAGLALGADGKLLVADTYNHKISRLIPRHASPRHLPATGKAGHRRRRTGRKRCNFLSRPPLAAVSATETFIADTNNHRIVRFGTRRMGLGGSW